MHVSEATWISRAWDWPHIRPSQTSSPFLMSRSWMSASPRNSKTKTQMSASICFPLAPTWSSQINWTCLAPVVPQLATPLCHHVSSGTGLLGDLMLCLTISPSELHLLLLQSFPLCHLVRMSFILTSDITLRKPSPNSEHWIIWLFIETLANIFYLTRQPDR